jgi:hypothetical protein
VFGVWNNIKKKSWVCVGYIHHWCQAYVVHISEHWGVRIEKKSKIGVRKFVEKAVEAKEVVLWRTKKENLEIRQYILHENHDHENGRTQALSTSQMCTQKASHSSQKFLFMSVSSLRSYYQTRDCPSLIRTPFVTGLNGKVCLTWYHADFHYTCPCFVPCDEQLFQLYVN